MNYVEGSYSGPDNGHDGDGDHDGHNIDDDDVEGSYSGPDNHYYDDYDRNCFYEFGHNEHQQVFLETISRTDLMI